MPLARFVAEHRAELAMPFKRYHIAKVWRGENTQKGRYREFTQCDFDTIGTTSAASDAETLLLMHKALDRAGVRDFTILVNHRGLFNRLLEKLGIAGKLTDVLRAVDKLSKTGRDDVQNTLAGLAGSSAAEAILAFIELDGDWDAVLAAMTEMAGGPNPDSDRLAEIARFIDDSGCKGVYKIAPSITRGLDYYTGIVFETMLNALPSIGSVCSGGRYDNLSALYSKEVLPGVGASIGLDRLIAALEALNALNAAPPYAQCAIASLHAEHYGSYARLAGAFRDMGISCEIFDEPKKLTTQFIFAEKKGIRWVIIPSESSPAEKPLTARLLAERKDYTNLSVAEVVSLIRRLP